MALRNEVTRDQCKKYLENKPDSSKIPKHLWDAENEAHSHLGVDHVIWTGLNVEIGVEYRKIFVVLFF